MIEGPATIGIAVIFLFVSDALRRRSLAPVSRAAEFEEKMRKIRRDE